MKHLLIRAALAICVAISCVNAFKLTDCTRGKDAGAKLNSVKISSCSLSDSVCYIQLGTNVTMTAEFTTTRPFKDAKLKVSGRVGPLAFTFPLKPDDPCGVDGFNCPVDAQKTQKLQISVAISKAYPRVGATVVLEMFDELKRPLICLSFPAKLVQKKKNVIKSKSDDSFPYWT